MVEERVEEKVEAKSASALNEGEAIRNLEAAFAALGVIVTHGPRHQLGVLDVVIPIAQDGESFDSSLLAPRFRLTISRQYRRSVVHVEILDRGLSKVSEPIHFLTDQERALLASSCADERTKPNETNGGRDGEESKAGEESDVDGEGEEDGGHVGEQGSRRARG